MNQKVNKMKELFLLHTVTLFHTLPQICDRASVNFPFIIFVDYDDDYFYFCIWVQ